MERDISKDGVGGITHTLTIMSKTITEQVATLQKQRENLKVAYMNRTGEDVGKITDDDALHELSCLEDTIRLMEGIKKQDVILFNKMNYKL
jgi:hypothetical protein